MFSHSAVISSQGKREAIKSNSLQLKLYKADKYEFPLFKTNGFSSDNINKNKNLNDSTVKRIVEN